MKVVLNGKEYSLEGGVAREAIAEWTTHVKQTSVRGRDTRSYLSSYAKESWDGGLGIRRAILGIDEDRFWDSDAETRFPGQITPPPLAIQDTIDPAVPLLSPFVLSSGLYAISPRTGTNVFFYKYAVGVGWGSFCALASYGYQTWDEPVCAVLRQSDSILYLYSKDYLFRYGIGSLVLLDAADIVNVPSCVYGKAISHREDTHAALGDDSNTRTFRVGSTQQLLYNKTLGGLISIPKDIMGTHSVLLSTPDSLYADIQASLATELVTGFDLTDRYGGRGLIEWNGAVFYPQSQGRILAYKPGVITEITPMSEDGMPDEFSGAVTASAKSAQWLFMGRSADISTRKANIQVFDGLSWHKLWSDTATGRVITDMLVTLLDNVPRLHFFLAPTQSILGATLAYHIPYYANNPFTTGSLTVATLGCFTDSEFQGVMPEISAGFYRLWIEAKALGGGKKITAVYGLDGADPAVTLGQVSTTSGYLTFGNQGVEARSIQMKYWLERGTLAGTYPQLLFTVLEYLKQPDIRETFSLSVNVMKTAQLTQRGEEAILTELRTLRNTRTLVPFWYGKQPTRMVKIEPPATSQEFLEEHDLLDAGERKAIVQLRLIEI